MRSIRPSSVIVPLASWLTALLALTFASSASAAVTERSVYYSYDLAGRQLTAKFDSATGADGITNTYNGFGDLTSSQVSMSGFTKKLTSSYDGAGRRAQLVHPENTSTYTFEYCYDALSRLTTIRNGTSCTATQLGSFSYGTNGLVSSHSDGSLGVSHAGYTWDDIGRLTSQSDNFAGSSSDVTWTLGYNPASQIVSDVRDNDSYAWTGAVSVNRSYNVNGLNQYTSAGSASFTYDDNGNLIGDGTNSYTYDVENRLVSAVSGTVTTSLTYDPVGRLYEVKKKTGATTNSDTLFVYDGDALVLEYDNTQATPPVTNRYVHGANAAADDPLIWYSGATLATLRYLHADHLGSIVAATNCNNGNCPNTYDEYGIPGSANVGRFQYTGQAWLTELGLYYYKARFYSPTLGRFLQTDPIGYKDQINLYAYVGNDPTNGNDPTGQYECQTGPSCDAAKEGIKEIREARNFYASAEIGSRIPRDASAAGALDKILGALGTKGDGGVTINAQNTLGPKGENGNFNPSTNTINLYARQMRDSGERTGETLAHETEHYRLRSERLGSLAREVRPFGIQYIVGRAPGGTIGPVSGREFIKSRIDNDAYCGFPAKYCDPAVGKAMNDELAKPF